MRLTYSGPRSVGPMKPASLVLTPSTGLGLVLISSTYTPGAVYSGILWLLSQTPGAVDAPNRNPEPIQGRLLFGPARASSTPAGDAVRAGGVVRRIRSLGKGTRLRSTDPA